MTNLENKNDELALQQVREDRFLIDKYDEWLYEEISPFLGDRILEIGCGLGNFIRFLNDKEFVFGIDINNENIEILKTKYRGYTNIKFEFADITEENIIQYNRFYFDTAISLNTFEHISNDELALKQASKLLSPKGNLILIVPAHKYLYGTMDISLGHYRRYSKKDLQEKLKHTGFKLIMQKYVNFFGAFGWFINGRVFRHQVPPQNQLKIMNIVVPFIHKFEQIITPPLGISLITIAERDL